ncbi:MAG: type II secretion system F family protein [Pirellulales bacterium]|nr:type II secretion system F family protein [Pirellulales bacterium]
MPEFAYTARNAAGEDVFGTISAGSKRETLLALGERNLYALHVECRETVRKVWRRPGRVKTQVLATNLRQLADLLDNGVPLLAALEILADQAAQPALADVLSDVRQQVAEGSSLDQAMARHPRVFSDLTVSIVRAGAEGSFLEDSLKRTADFLEMQEELKARLVGAMTYPAFLAVVGFVVTAGLIVFMVPKFATLFTRLEKQGGGLPAATIVLLAISDVLGRWGLPILAGVAGLGIYVRRVLRSERGCLLVDRWKLKIPLAGKIFLGYAVSRFCRVLGTLLRNGVPLLRALDISSDSAGNSVLAGAIRESAENISSGDTLARPLAQCGLIPRPVMAMISVAEESNNLEDVLINIADGIDRTNARRIDVMVRLVEPMMLLIMGTIIMFVITALLLPVFDLSATMS